MGCGPGLPGPVTGLPAKPRQARGAAAIEMSVNSQAPKLYRPDFRL